MAADVARQQRGVVQQAGADLDRVAAVAKFDVEGDVCLFVHCSPCMLARAGIFLRGQLVQYGLNHRLYVRPAGVDHEVGDLAVQRIAFGP